MRWLVAIILLAAPAFAGKHKMERGQTLEHVARLYGCSVESLLKANRLKTTLVAAGRLVEVPPCNVRRHARTRTIRGADDRDLDERAEQALAVIDGTAIVGESESVGQPWNGSLRNGQKLPIRDGYEIRRPQRAFAARHVVDHLQQAIAVVRALYPGVHTLAIGDLSARTGGKIAAHRSHQSGLDVDVGFYFRKVPAGYPQSFAPANRQLDLEAMWALVTAFVRTADLDTGVDVIFLDYDVQERLYEFARKRGTPDADLEAILQYPRGKSAIAGIVRHWPNHADHMHVRFRPAR
ncbi:MAG: penicillin-insensitive murein endopeptidase [Kofleriaceae bacterium]